MRSKQHRDNQSCINDSKVYRRVFFGDQLALSWLRFIFMIWRACCHFFFIWNDTSECRGFGRIEHVTALRVDRCCFKLRICFTGWGFGSARWGFGSARWVFEPARKVRSFNVIAQKLNFHKPVCPNLLANCVRSVVWLSTHAFSIFFKSCNFYLRSVVRTHPGWPSLIKGGDHKRTQNHQHQENYFHFFRQYFFCGKRNF